MLTDRNTEKRVLLPFQDRTRLTPYADAVLAAGLQPVPADVSGPVELGSVDGLLLLGGTDVNPSRYGALPHPKTEPPDDRRDEIELQLIEEALSRGIPILAICRGLQLLNVYYGGTLIQHVANTERHAVKTENKGQSAHEVVIEPDTLLSGIAQAGSWQVNSRHHQAVDTVGERLKVVARDPLDGTVEALESEGDGFVLAVQWHPEDQVKESPDQLRLFKRFAQELGVREESL